VVKTELEAGSPQQPLRITTRFAADSRLGIDVPTEMHYTAPGRGRDEQGVARYSNFRRFQVRTQVN
jgi:hypothetical protein